jgi:hypothetical protein
VVVEAGAVVATVRHRLAVMARDAAAMLEADKVVALRRLLRKPSKW